MGADRRARARSSARAMALRSWAGSTSSVLQPPQKDEARTRNVSRRNNAFFASRWMGSELGAIGGVRAKGSYEP